MSFRHPETEIEEPLFVDEPLGTSLGKLDYCRPASASPPPTTRPSATTPT